MAKIKSICLYLALFVVGASVLLIEILGTRILAPFFGSTIFTWSSLITVTMACLALGYWFGGKLADKKPQAGVMFVIIFIAGLSTWIIPKMDERVLLWSDNFGLQYGPLTGALALFGLPLLLLGSISPYVIRLKSVAVEDNGKLAGRIFAIATAGSLVGAILAGFVLLPIMSLSTIFSVIAISLIIIAIIGLVLEKKIKQPTIIALILISLVSMTMPSFDILAEGSLHILHEEQSFYGDIKVAKQGPYTCLYVDTMAQSCLNQDKQTDARYIQAVKELIGQQQPDNILILGLAGGSLLTAIPDNVPVVGVELDPTVTKLAREWDIFPEHDNLIIHYDDARHWLRNNKQKYDIIIVDLLNGQTPPDYMLTVEALGEMKNSLSSTGVIFFNTLLFPTELTDQFTLSVNRSLREVFDFVYPIAYDKDDLQDLNFLVANQSIPDLVFSKYKLVEDLPVEGVVVTDNYNPLSGYFQSHLFMAREDIDSSNANLYFIK